MKPPSDAAPAARAARGALIGILLLASQCSSSEAFSSMSRRRVIGPSSPTTIASSRTPVDTAMNADIASGIHADVHVGSNPRTILKSPEQNGDLTARMALDATDSMSKDNENTKQDAATSSVAQGRILLLVVALLYGTLTVSMRSVYGAPDPPSASMLSATRGWLAAFCFIPPLLLSRKDANTAGQVETTAVETPTTETATQTSSGVWKAALELAVWNFGAQGLLSIGLLSTESARAAFLTQTSVVMTPLLSMASGQSVPGTVWVGCFLALIGLVLLSGVGDISNIMSGIGGIGGMSSIGSMDGMDSAGGMAMSMSVGDGFVLGGALCWSLYLFRLTQLASNFKEGDELSLQAGKTSILAVLYSVWAIFPLMTSGSGDAMQLSSGIAMLGGWATNPMVWLVLLYSALGPGTVADVLQQQGQKKVPSATEANILLSLEPVFAALCAWSLLGETLSMPETFGGALILLAALVSTKDDAAQQSD